MPNARLAQLRREFSGNRCLHAAGHLRRVQPVPRNAVFNLDLHIAVIADIRTMLESRGLDLTSWSISAHTWVFGRERDPVAVVNEQTAYYLGPGMVRRFQRVYGNYLRSFAGFVVTHTPSFSLLYDGWSRPTLAVCSTRYEWPFTFDRSRWAWLNDRLGQAVQDGWLHLLANNRVDADYFENYTGIRLQVIPSACAYIAPTYTGRRSTVLVAAGTDQLAATVCAELKSDVAPLRRALGPKYHWAQVYDHRAIVFIPYNVSVMALFEHYSACAPIYVPAPGFLKTLMAKYPREVLSQLSYAQGFSASATPPNPGARDLNDLRDVETVDWYLERADFYDETWMPRIRKFESWSHLDHLLASDDQLAISRQMAVEKTARLNRISELWDEVAWLERVQAQQAEPHGEVGGRS